ncbi:hypothetical protein C2W62_53510, partial [Candidatus Entotheonella serta]
VGPLDDGTRLYEGPWKVTREDDDRHFVIVEPKASKTLVSWGSPPVAAPKERAARDMRKQTIMRICTLFLENLLQAFKSELLSILPK